MRKIAVAMSGGVDSTMAAYMLKKKGWQVAGFFLQLKFPDCPNKKWKESEGKAFSAARMLGVPMYKVDARDVFKKKVWDSFWKKQLSGVTPNPCPNCNPVIKFGFLKDKAEKLGFPYLATGHYARIEKNSRWKLLRGKDKAKDQTYFLHRIPYDSLSHIVFPLGKSFKKDVQKKAKKIFSLGSYDDSESQGICFVQNENFPVFMKRILPKKKGRALDKKGEYLGEHQGSWFFTEGQRSGLGSVPSKTKPYYVLSKNLPKNEVVLTDNASDPQLFTSSIKVKNIHWINSPKERTFKAEVQIRYGAKAELADVKVFKGFSKVDFKKPQRAVTPGQSAVFYDNEEVLGGGEISR